MLSSRNFVRSLRSQYTSLSMMTLFEGFEGVHIWMLGLVATHVSVSTCADPDIFARSKSCKKVAEVAWDATSDGHSDPRRSVKDYELDGTLREQVTLVSRSGSKYWRSKNVRQPELARHEIEQDAN